MMRNLNFECVFFLFMRVNPQTTGSLRSIRYHHPVFLERSEPGVGEFTPIKGCYELLHTSQTYLYIAAANTYPSVGYPGQQQPSNPVR